MEQLFTSLPLLYTSSQRIHHVTKGIKESKPSITVTTQVLQEMEVGLIWGGPDAWRSTASCRYNHHSLEILHPPIPRVHDCLPYTATLFISYMWEYKNCPKRWNCMSTCTNRDGICCSTKKICGLKFNWETCLIVLRQDPHFRYKYRCHMFPHTSTAFSYCYYCWRLLPEMASCKSQVREERCVHDEMNPTSNVLSKVNCIVGLWKRLPREAMGLSTG